MANLTSKLFGLHNATTVDGDDSRTQGDENLNALAGSMETSFPNLIDQAVTVDGAHLNWTPTRNGNWTVTGSWSFTQALTLTNASAMNLTNAGLTTITKSGAGNLVIDTPTAAIILQSNSIAALSVSNSQVTAAPSIVSNNNITAAGSLEATTGNVTAGGYVQTDELRTANVGPATVNTITGYMPLYSTSGTVIGYLPVYNFV